MSDVIGFDITPNSGSALRKVLRLNLGQFMDRLEAISVSANCRKKGPCGPCSIRKTRFDPSAMNPPLHSTPGAVLFSTLSYPGVVNVLLPAGLSAREPMG